MADSRTTPELQPDPSLDVLVAEQGGVPATAIPAPGTVEIWTTSLDVSAPCLERFQRLLSEAELERSRRFRFTRDRHYYVAAHGWVRETLSRYLAVRPACVGFAHGPKGKPRLSGEAATSGLEFNLAHSAGLAVLAVARDTPVGIDVEQVRPLPDFAELVTRFFSPNEALQFHAGPEQHRCPSFFNLWTRKEAWLKATGEGITDLLGEVEVSFAPGEPAQLLRVPNGFEEPAQWSLSDWIPAPGFVGAVAAAAPGIRAILHEDGSPAEEAEL